MRAHTLVVHHFLDRKTLGASGPDLQISLLLPAWMVCHSASQDVNVHKAMARWEG